MTLTLLYVYNTCIIEDLIWPHVIKTELYAANQFLNRVQVVPLTGSVGKLYPSETYVSLRGKKAKAMADQLTTVSKKRLINQAGTVSKTEMERIERAISIQLDL